MIMNHLFEWFLVLFKKCDVSVLRALEMRRRHKLECIVAIADYIDG